jgi:hypothetical protein
VARSIVTSKRVDGTVVLLLCGVGAALRVPGLTRADPWFDDAWATLPSRVPLSSAVHMVVTTPLYAFALRWWIELRPTQTWWSQLPALAFGIAGIAAVYGLIRALGYSRLAAFAAGAVVVAGPIAVAYSSRLKEYPVDLLCACLVLWLVERWRSQPTRRGLVLLAVASIGCLWVSASTAAVVGGAAVVVVVVAWTRRDLRRDAVVLVGALAAASAGLWAVFLRHVPSQLRTNWRTNGYLFGYSSGRHVIYEFQQTFSGLAHGFVGVPIPYTFQGFALRGLPMTLAIVTCVALIALVAPPVAEVIASRGSTVPPTAAAAATMLLAVLGTLVGASPLGDGRTDEVLYPALLVLLVGAATTLARQASGAARTRDVARVATVVVIGVGAVWFGTTHVAAYPPTGLRAVIAGLRTKLLPGDVVVVDGYESFTWADDDLAPWKVSFQTTQVPWPMGFHVVSEDPTYVMSTNYLQPDEQIDKLSLHTRRVWFVGPTVGGFSTEAPAGLWGFPDDTPTLMSLVEFGWHKATPVPEFQAPGVYAQLYVYRRS